MFQRGNAFCLFFADSNLTIYQLNFKFNTPHTINNKISNIRLLGSRSL